MTGTVTLFKKPCEIRDDIYDRDGEEAVRLKTGQLIDIYV